MAKINILTKDIYNRISAGEVVDRPYSAVKELIENSLDAKATEIEIAIEKGGKQLIRVVDNGCGIERDDLRSAFIPHATSKITTVEDLDKITTLGFRGEALASIASISQTEIISVVEGAEACKVVCEEGYIGKVQPAALEKGTEINVHNLFFNTPVRAKFLKTDKAEESDITNFVSRYILGNPQVSFRYFVDGKLSLQSHGGGLDEAMAEVYGAKVLPQCFKIDAVKNDIHIYGFIGNQNFFKPNRTYQSLFLNGRYIVNQVISSAITNAYASYAMKRQYPFYVLFIDVPLDIFDVNVHPNKADVRFVNNQQIYGTVYSVLSAILDGSAKAADFVIGSTTLPEMKSTMSGEQQTILYRENQPAIQSDTNAAQTGMNAAQTGMNAAQTNVSNATQNHVPFSSAQGVTRDRGEFDERVIYHEPKSKKAIPQKPAEEEESPYAKYEREAPSPIIDRERAYSLSGLLDSRRDTTEMSVAGSPFRDLIDHIEEEPQQFDKIVEGQRAQNSTQNSTQNFNQNTAKMPVQGETQFTQKPTQSKLQVEKCVYKGNLFNTYLIYEYENEAYLIDQHAAHERLLFDKLKQKLANRTINRQGMLVPYVLVVNADEKQFMEKTLPFIREIGFDMEPFGANSYRVNEVPADLQDIQIDQFFKEILSDVNSLKTMQLDDILKDKIAMTACKSAIKGGWELTQEEIAKLFEMMDGNMGLKCPHGRPVCVKLTKTDIEKMFKRIV